MQPHNEHIVVLPVAIDQLLAAALRDGLDDAGIRRPDRACCWRTAALVFVYVRRRVGPWPGADGGGAAALPRPRLAGPALAASRSASSARSCSASRCCWRWSATTAAGTSPPASCLALSIGFSSLGRRPSRWARPSTSSSAAAERGLRRAYVAAVPLRSTPPGTRGWGHEAEGHLSLHNVLVSPRFVVEGLAASVDSLLALSTIADEAVGRSKWGYAVLAVLVALVVYALASAGAPLLAAASGRSSPRRPPSGSWPASTTSPAGRPTRAGTCTRGRPSSS